MRKFYIENNELKLNSKKDFNFGAFSLGWLWGIGNGVFLKTFLLNLLAYILLIIPIIGWVGAIAIFVYIGKNGNEWANKGKVWISQDEFEKAQLKWNIAGIYFLVIVVLILFISAYSFINTGYKYINKQFSFKPNIKNTGSYMLIYFIKSRPELINADNPTVITNYLINNKPLNFLNNATKYNDNSNAIILDMDNAFTYPGDDYLPKGYENAKAIYKFDKSQNCLLKKKNCSITYYLKNDCHTVAVTKTFYNNKGGTDVISYYQDDKKAYKYEYTNSECK